MVKKPTEFYQGAIAIIYGVIIGLSFTQVDILFIPITKIYHWPNIIDTFAAFFAYFFVITGWIGYHRSIADKPHSGRIGDIRFAVDLFIVYLAYYLVTIVIPKLDANGDIIANYSETFTWVLPTMFLTFVIWDILKNLEYRHLHADRGLRFRRLVYSGFMFVAFMIILLFYDANPSLSNILPSEEWRNKYFYDWFWILISLILVVIYRIVLKWSVRHTPRARRRRTGQDTTLDNFN